MDFALISKVIVYGSIGIMSFCAGKLIWNVSPAIKERIENSADVKLKAGFGKAFFEANFTDKETDKESNGKTNNKINSNLEDKGNG